MGTAGCKARSPRGTPTSHSPCKGSPPPATVVASMQDCPVSGFREGLWLLGPQLRSTLPPLPPTPTQPSCPFALPCHPSSPSWDLLPQGPLLSRAMASLCLQPRGSSRGPLRHARLPVSCLCGPCQGPLKSRLLLKEGGPRWVAWISTLAGQWQGLVPS